ncbi:NAD(P)-binding domain protein [Metarhizium rileyi]|uniref:NAD(P)-binding domain protein n=1 Tax=Metarhizium rileyi (strain RCEF 4871) TaxID=1649241 RepID=A0A167KHT7_METRR|nr:NAD(P)-binding domain protein [Metarhizium rileyi RCEF 4871]
MADSLSPYANLYDNPSGPGDQRPTALQVVEDNGAAGTWSGRVVLVTGGTAGLGVETVRAMHSTGADVYFTARSPEKAAATKADILKTTSGTGRLEVVEMDMDSLDSVREAAAAFLNKSSSKLNVLINNAGKFPPSTSPPGIMACPHSSTKDGFERQFAVNHLAHYLLTRLLLPALLGTATPGFGSRVVNVSSSAHRMAPVNLDDYNLDNKYDPWLAYAQSKTANIWTASYIDRTLGSRGVHALSLHPGGILTGLQAYTPAEMLDAWKQDADANSQMMSPPQGAATSVWAAVGTVWEGKGGKYLANCSVPGYSDSATSLLDIRAAPHTYDAQGEDRLWELSAKLVAVDKDV